MLAESGENACAACGLHLYGQENSCQSCGAIYCGSCFSLKAKLDLSVGKSSSLSIPCQSCTNLLKIKKQSRPISEDGNSAPHAGSNSSSTSGSIWSNDHPHASHQASHQASAASVGNRATTETDEMAVDSIPAQKWTYPKHQSTRSTKAQYRRHNAANGFDEEWSDIDEATVKDNLTDFYEDIPYALKLCGLVSEEEMQIACYKQMISIIDKERQLLGKEDEQLVLRQQILKNKLAILNKQSNTSGVHSRSNPMLHHSMDSQQSEESLSETAFKPPVTTINRHFDKPKPRKNQGELGSIVSNQTSATNRTLDNANDTAASNVGEEMELNPTDSSSGKVQNSAEMNIKLNSKNDYSDDPHNINDSYGQELKQSNPFKSNQESVTSGALTVDAGKSKLPKHQPGRAVSHKVTSNQSLASGGLAVQFSMSNSSGVSSFRTSFSYKQPMSNKKHSLQTETNQNVQASTVDADKDTHENPGGKSYLKHTAERTTEDSNVTLEVNGPLTSDKGGSKVSQTDNKHSKTAEDKMAKQDKERSEKPLVSKDAGGMLNQNSSTSSPSPTATKAASFSKKKVPVKVQKAEEFLNLEALERDDDDNKQEETRNEPYACSLVSDAAADPVNLAFILLSSSSTSDYKGNTPFGSKAPRALLFMDSKSFFDKNKKQSRKIQEIPIDEEKTKPSGDDKKQHTSQTPAIKYPSSTPNKAKANKNSPPNQTRLNSTKQENATDIPTSTSIVNSAVSASIVDSLNPSKNNVIPGSNVAPVHSRMIDGSEAKVVEEKDVSSHSKPAPVLRLRKSAGASSIAEKYYVGFLRLKQRQTAGGGQKCSSCGSSECQGENMQSMTRMIKSARENGFQLQDVTPDGNCMFAAVIDQLSMYGDERFTSKTLRQAAVRWLEDHPYTECGTPKSEFLSEDWLHYIDRMSKDGEWGDHMILGAVVEVVGCTIRVMSPTDSAVHWTTLEPQGEGAVTDDKHLILGHVGEFHYTSLRPTARQKGASNSNTADWQAVEDDKTETEEDVLVCMFREDHIDSPSDLPVAHFSYLLKTIIPESVLEKATIFMSEYSTDSMEEAGQDGYQGSFKSAGICVGGVGEGVHVPSLDGVISPDTTDPPVTSIFFLTMNKNLKVVQKDTPLRYSNDCTECILDDGGSKPGYTRLYVKETKLRLVRPESEKDDKMNSVGQNMRITQELFTFFVIECKVWPEAAISWQKRQRFQGWPSEDFIQSVVSDGCLLKAPSQPDPSGAMFEFWFALVEKRIFREIASQHQKHCYIMFKTLCRQTFQMFDKVSQAIKNIFLYACEHIPSEEWETNPGACVLHMLEELVNSLQSRFIPSYFIEAQNLLENLADLDLDRLIEEVQILRLQPLLCLRQVHEIAMIQHKGHEIIDRVADDIPNFKQHKSVRRSILDAFVPSTILIAKDNILTKQYRKGYEILSKAYEERLAISTCDDTMSYQMFLTAALSGLDLKSMTWFSAYADRNLQGQLSRSLIRELCSDLPLGQISQLLPADVAGEYSSTEVPLEFFQNVGQFCLDFAKFLYMIERIPAALPVLYHCYERYKEERKSREGSQLQTGEGKKEELFPDVQDAVMLEVFVGMCRIYTHQGQLEFFRGLLPEIKLLCKRLNTNEAYITFMYFCQKLEDITPMQDIIMHHPNIITDIKDLSHTYYGQLKFWPYKYATMM